MNKTTPTARLIKKFIKMKDDKIWELKNEKENCVLWKYDAEHSWYLHLRDGKDYDLSWHDDYIWELENDLWSYPSINEYDYDGVNLFFKFVKKIHWETKLGWN